MSAAHEGPAPGGCGRALDRRTFLRQATGYAGAVLVALGAAPSVADAVVRELRPEEHPAASPGARLRRYALPAADGALVDVDDEVLLVRWAGRIHAFALACPHRGATLQWRGAEGAYCPKHKARFGPDGAHVGGRRTRALDRYSIRREGAQVVVELGVALEQDAHAAAWAAAWVPAT